MSAEQKTSALPWADDATNFIGCNYGYGNLAIHLPKALEINGRLHAETYVAACGAVAGFAAQQALLVQRPEFRIDDLKEDSMVDGLFLFRGPRGDRFIFGDPLKLMIFLKEGPATAINAKLWEWASGGAIAAGLSSSEMPDTGAMWNYVTRAIKDGTDGALSVPPEHQPHLSPAQCLELLWPLTKKCLSGRVGDGALAPPELVVVEPRWWTTITAMVTSGAIQKVKDVLAPRIALTLAMEAAMFALKIDPTAVEKL